MDDTTVTTFKDPTARVTTLFYEFLNKLETAGYVDFVSSNSKRALRLLCSKVKPPKLRTKVRQRLDYNKELKESPCDFVDELIEAAKHQQQWGSAAKTKNGDSADMERKNKLGKDTGNDSDTF